MKTIATRFGAIALGGVLFTTALAGPVQARPWDPNAAPQQAVRYGDLDLSTTHGQDALKSRITSAIAKVCGKGVADMSLSEYTLVRKCMTRASSEADVQIAQVMLRGPGATMVAIAQRR